MLLNIARLLAGLSLHPLLKTSPGVGGAKYSECTPDGKVRPSFQEIEALPPIWDVLGAVVRPAVALLSDAAMPATIPGGAPPACGSLGGGGGIRECGVGAHREAP